MWFGRPVRAVPYSCGAAYAGREFSYHTTGRTSTALTTNQYSDIVLAGDLGYEVDLWGQVRRTIEASRENAQASAGDLENVNLSLHSELAIDYFSLRGLDLQKQLLDATVIDFEKALDLTQVRFHGGVASDVDVSLAETQLEQCVSQDIDTGVATGTVGTCYRSFDRADGLQFLDSTYATSGAATRRFR